MSEVQQHPPNYGVYVYLFLIYIPIWIAIKNDLVILISIYAMLLSATIIFSYMKRKKSKKIEKISDNSINYYKKYE